MVPQVSSAGATISAPVRSDSHQVRQTFSVATAGRSPAIQMSRRPMLAPSSVPAAEQAISVSTSRTRSPGVRAPRRTSSAAAMTMPATVPSDLPEAPGRTRVE